MLDLKSALVASLLTASSVLGAAHTVHVAGVKATMSNTAVKAAAITCPQGQSLTYSIITSPISGVSLSAAQAYFSRWTQDGPGAHISSTGNNAVGSTRVYNSTDGSLRPTASIRETLTQIIPPSGNGANLEQKWQTSATEAYYSGSVLFYSDYSDVTVGQQSGASAPFIQFYKNVCTNNQQQAYNILSALLQDSTAYWITALRTGPPTSSSTPPPPPTSTVSLPPANPTSTSIQCKSGQNLVYVDQLQMDPGVTLASAQQYFKNWQGDAPGSPISSSGNNGVGSTRRWSVTDSSLQSVAPINEVLTAVINPTSGNSNLRQQWQITSSQGYYGGKLIVYQSFSDLTIGENSNGQVFLQFFQNVCANDKNLANQAVPTIISDALNFWNARA